MKRLYRRLSLETRWLTGRIRSWNRGILPGIISLITHGMGLVLGWAGKCPPLLVRLDASSTGRTRVLNR